MRPRRGWQSLDQPNVELQNVRRNFDQFHQARLGRAAVIVGQPNIQFVERCSEIAKKINRSHTGFMDLQNQFLLRIFTSQHLYGLQQFGSLQFRRVCVQVDSPFVIEA